MKSHQIRKTNCNRTCSQSKPLMFLMLEVVIGLQLIAIVNYVITSMILLGIFLLVFLIKPIKMYFVVRKRPCTKVKR